MVSTEYIALATAVCVLFGTMLSVFVSLRSSLKKNTELTNRNIALTHKLSIDVDGRLTELLTTTRALSRAEGVIEGQTSSAIMQEITAEKQLAAAEVQTVAAKVQTVAAEKQTIAANKQEAVLKASSPQETGKG